MNKNTGRRTCRICRNAFYRDARRAGRSTGPDLTAILLDTRRNNAKPSDTDGRISA